MSDRFLTIAKPVDLSALTRELRVLDPDITGLSLNAGKDLTVHNVGLRLVITDAQIAAVVAAHTLPPPPEDTKKKAKDAIDKATASKKLDDAIEALAAIREAL